MATTEQVVIEFSERGVRDTTEYVRKLGGEAGKAADKTDRLSDASGTLARRSKEAGRDVNLVTEALTKLAYQTGAVIGGIFAVGTSFNEALRLDKALAEVNTLLPQVGDQLGYVEDQARKMAVEFGSSAVEQTKGFYEILSAGAKDAAEAQSILVEANKLAVAGVTTVGSSVNLLTGVLNSYSAAGLTAAQASDAISIAVRDGKTTVEELASSMGRVTPIASALGVSFDEVSSAIAAVTTQGVATSEAVTGLNALLLSIAKPTKDASDAAKAYGIELSVAALQTKGFAGFMAEVTKKTGGSKEAITQLFGSVEAMRVAFALSGAGGEQFNKTLTSMAEKAGTTDTMFNVVAQSASFKWSQAVAAATEIGITFGNILLTVVAPALSLFANNIDLIIALLPAVGTGLLFAFGPSILASIVAIKNAVLAFNVTLAANPVGLFVVAVVAAVGIIYTYRDAIKEAFTSTGVFGKTVSWLIDMLSQFVDVVSELIGITSANAKENANLAGSNETLEDRIKKAAEAARRQAEELAKAGAVADAAKPKVLDLAAAYGALPAPAGAAGTAVMNFGSTTATAAASAQGALKSMAVSGTASFEQLAAAALSAASTIQSASSGMGSGSMFSNMAGSSMFQSTGSRPAGSFDAESIFESQNAELADLYQTSFNGLYEVLLNSSYNAFGSLNFTAEAKFTDEANALFADMYNNYIASIKSLNGQVDAQTTSKLNQFEDILFNNGKLDINSQEKANKFIEQNQDLAPYLKDIFAELFNRGFLKDAGTATDYYDTYFKPETTGTTNDKYMDDTTKPSSETSAYGGKYSFGAEPEKKVTIDTLNINLYGITDVEGFKRSREQLLAALRSELENAG